MAGQDKSQEQLLPSQGSKVKKEDPGQSRPLELHSKSLSSAWLHSLTFPTNALGYSLIFLASDAKVACLLSLPYSNFFLQIWAIFSLSLWYNCMFPPRGVKWFVVVALTFPHAVTSTAIWCLQALGREKTYIIRKVNNDTKALLLRFSGWLFKSEKQ